MDKEYFRFYIKFPIVSNLKVEIFNLLTFYFRSETLRLHRLEDEGETNWSLHAQQVYIGIQGFAIT